MWLATSSDGEFACFEYSPSKILIKSVQTSTKLFQDETMLLERPASKPRKMNSMEDG